MRRLVGALAMVMVGCLNPVSDVPDSGPEHRFLGDIPYEDIDPNYAYVWLHGTGYPRGIPALQMFEHPNGDLFLNPIEGVFRADGGYVAAAPPWRAVAAARGRSLSGGWLSYRGQIYKSKLPSSSDGPGSAVGRFDPASFQLQPAFEFPRVPSTYVVPYVAAFEHVWFSQVTTSRSERFEGFVEMRDTFDGPAVHRWENYFSVHAATPDGDVTLLLTNAVPERSRLLRIRDGGLNFEDNGRLWCFPALDFRARRLDYMCAPDSPTTSFTAFSANADETKNLGSFTLPDGHVAMELVSVEPLLVVTALATDGGPWVAQACNATTCKPIGDFSRWPPMVGATPESLSIAHYEPDAGVFMWRHRRSTLGL